MMQTKGFEKRIAVLQNLLSQAEVLARESDFELTDSEWFEIIHSDLCEFLHIARFESLRGPTAAMQRHMHRIQIDLKQIIFEFTDLAEGDDN